MNTAGTTPGWGEEDALPRRFGQFVLFDKIGEGGMARLYLGRRDTELGGEQLVVVKEILPLLSSSAEFSRLFVDEAKLAGKLTHGNIAKVIDLGREDGGLYIAMEYIEGFDLRELLKQCTRQKVPLPIEFALLIMMETLKALDYAHRKRDEDGAPLNIVHRDVSPSNVLVSFEGEVKLCDFGIARAIGAGEALPDEAIQGKAGYMSPEAASGGAVDARSDVFALGIMLWELLAGRRLYKGEAGRPPSLQQAQAAEVPELPQRGLKDEEILRDVVTRALSKDPNIRFQSASEMLRELEDYVRGAELNASPLRFGEWLMDHFGSAIVDRRRAQERAARVWDERDRSGPQHSSAPVSEHARVPSDPYADRSSEPGPARSYSDEFSSEPVSVVQVEQPPPSLTAVVAPSQPEPPASSGNNMIVIVIVVLVVALALLGVYTQL